ncbi:Tetraspanin [Operophtera brumata]|uniref:Tetraspanin n=1 Tax=Operophtera brumata TaxID=104452 RepID=A0A0L7L5M6_OPEBR|nr:Tetraspanin [Operophtera brumata]
MANSEVGMKCIKYLLLCVTAIFVLTSALIISVGTTIYAIYHDVSFFLEDYFFSPATFIIVIGVMMLLRSQVTDMLDDRLRVTLPFYYENPELNCCGIDTYMDWTDVTPPTGTSGISVNNITIIGIVFSFSLASSIRRAKSERERRRWEIQERVINAYTSLNPEKEKSAPIVYVPFHGQTNA